MQREREGGSVQFTRRQALSRSALAAGVAAVTSIPVIDHVLATPDVPEEPGPVDPGEVTLDREGLSDETDAINRLLQQSDTVSLPSGTFKISGTVVVPRYKKLTGVRSSSYTGKPERGTRLIADDGDDPVVVLEEGGAISQISIAGSGDLDGSPRDGISLGGRNIVDGVTITGCRTGIGCNYTGVNRIISCHIHGNSHHGIVNPVDSVISLNFINVNNEHGIQFSSGANDNIISQNKIEWNRGCGLILEDTKHNVIATNIIDRNGNSGLRVADSSQTIVMGNILRRNGALSQESSDGDNHVLISGGFGSIVIGNSTETGPDDDGEGYESPKFSFVAQGQARGIAAINDLRGAVDSAIRMPDEGEGEFIVDLSYPRSSSVDLRSATPGDTGTQISVQAKSSVTASFKGMVVDEFSPGSIYNFRLLARNPADGERAVAKALVVVAREAGAASATIEEVTNLKGNLFSDRKKDSVVVVRSEASSDGSSISMEFENGSRHEQQIRVWMSET